ncbi:MAG TPA: peptide chain release factor N(5)-glutamine methyltransferase [Burkholderiaceae bacterium]|nr:peptide chain release factor N(5)-glutamine methyltransferase [Burkholderiaceae bacterium]
MSAAPDTVAQALARAKALGVDRLDAQLLLADALARPRSWLLAHDDARLEPVIATAWQARLERRAAGEPLAYLLGAKEFHGLMLQVDASVLVPRPDTEVLVDWAIELLRRGCVDVQRPHVVDLGTGSGAIALAVRHAHPAATVWATDASVAALEVARGNAQRLDLALNCVAGSWWEPLQGQRFQLALSNPPYIAAGDPHLEALRHEPVLALTPGGDGLDALRRVIADAPPHLDPGAWLLLEHGHDQAGAVQSLLHQHGFKDVQTRVDLAHCPRCTGARR